MPRARGRRSPLSAAALPDLGARPAARVPLLALGAASLLLGLVGGLARLGLVGGESLGPLVTHHGPLMAVGFLGTLIGVERAVAQRATWLLAAPLLTGGGVLLAAAGQAPLGPALAAAGAALLALGLARALHHRSAPWLVWQALGAASLAVGTAVWARAGWATPAVPWWTTFLVLTVAGERLELSRIALPPPRARRAFTVLALVLAAATVASLRTPRAAAHVLGLAWLGLGLWLLRFDLARRSVRRPGLSRYAATALLAGHGWLAAGGLGALVLGLPGAGPRHDAVLHAVLVGFVLSMVFGHAPMILPAVLGRRIVFRPVFWAHLVLLHATLAVRVVGDLVGAPALRAAGGAGNVAAVALFGIVTAWSLRGAATGPTRAGRFFGSLRTRR